MTKCNLCGSPQLNLYGYLGLNLVYCCRNCGNRFVETVEHVKESKLKVKAICKKMQKNQHRKN